MAYTEQTWQDNNPAYPVSAARMNHIEAGISSLSPDIIIPAPTGVAATDRANWISALANVPSGGRIYVPYAANPWLVDQTLTISNHCLIDGAGAFPTFGASSLTVPTGIVGSVVEQVTAATDVFNISTGVTPRVRGLGVTFSSSFYFNNTGHGFNLDSGSAANNGAMALRFDDVIVLGHDGNHYAYRLRNSLYGTLTHCFSYGGGGFALIADSSIGNVGNIVLVHPVAMVIAGGTGHGFLLSSSGSGPGLLNMLAFVRPQSILTNTSPFSPTNPVTNTQKPFSVSDGFSKRYSIIAPDFETTVSGATTALAGGSSPFFVDPGGSLADGSTFGIAIGQGEDGNRQLFSDWTVGGYSGHGLSNMFTKAALGTSPPAITNDGTSDDWRGKINFGTGTSPTTGDACDLRWSAGPHRRPPRHTWMPASHPIGGADA